jgi:aspartate aminotransferase-like enzyme
MGEVGRAGGRRGRVAVSPMQMDAWSVDVVVAGSQKGLMLPPGLAYVSVSDKAWAKIEKTQPAR